MTVIKQHLSNIWSLIHEKVKLRKRRLSWKKSVACKKSVYLDFCYTLATGRKLNLHKPNQKLIRNQDVKTWKPVMASSKTFCKTFKRKRSLVKVNKFKKIKNFDWLWKNCFFLCTACMLMFFFRELCFGRFSKCPINWWRRMENKTDTRKVKIESKTTRYCV